MTVTKQQYSEIPNGWKLVPIEPTSDQFGGMARDIIQWLRFTESKDQHSESLVKWLKDMGNEIPDWLYSEPEVNHLSKHVISKGSIAALIYKAMLAAAPKLVVVAAWLAHPRFPHQSNWWFLPLVVLHSMRA